MTVPPPGRAARPEHHATLGLPPQVDGHTVRRANDGQAAFTAAEEFLPEVAFLDIGMPCLNGYEVARRIRESSWGAMMHLIAISGWGQDADRRNGVEAGFNVHLVKPVAPETLSKLLSALAERPTDAVTGMDA